MAQPRIVFEPYASGAQREVVEEIINRRNIAITGHDQWYQVAFFVKTDDGEFWADCSALSGRSGFRSARSRCRSRFAARAMAPN
jgi:hypothetical protein